MNNIFLMDIGQQYIPIILKNNLYFKQYALDILEQYNFKVDENHLRKKLHIFLKASYRTDNIALAQRLIRGEYIGKDKGKVNWIWFGSKEIAYIAKNIVESYS